MHGLGFVTDFLNCRCCTIITFQGPVDGEVGSVLNTWFLDRAQLQVHLLRCKHNAEITICVVPLQIKGSTKRKDHLSLPVFKPLASSEIEFKPP